MSGHAATVDAALRRLAARKREWALLGPERRARYLRGAIAGVLESAERWVALACEAQGVAPGTAIAGEIRLSGPVVTVRGLRILAETLERGGSRPLPRVRRTADGRTIARVHPITVFDRVLTPGVVGDVWIRPEGPAPRGTQDGCVTLVLGAGNIASIAPLDVAHRMVAEGDVVLCKLSPVNAYLEPVFRRVFRDLVDDGYLEFVSGGPEVGAQASASPLVDAIHLTGSAETFEAIVWGADESERRRRKAAGEPLVDKPVTAELGCVTPVLVVPGPWSRRDLAFQATSVAGMLFHNVGFNCNAPKTLVLARGWELRDAFLSEVRHSLAALPQRRAYYPGALDRHRRVLERYPKAERLGREGDGIVPWTLVPDVGPDPAEPALREEAFCGVLAATSIDASDAASFLAAVPEFANGSVGGSLSCVVLVDPRTRRRHRDALDRAIARLRYGTVGVNVWTGLCFALGSTPWGAFPGNTRRAIDSGVGFVHNGLLLENPERSVVVGPFRPLVRPLWHPEFRTLDALSRRLLTFEAEPGWSHVPGIVAAAVQASL